MEENKNKEQDITVSDTDIISESLNDLFNSSLDELIETDTKVAEPEVEYTTELLENYQEISPTMTIEEAKQLVDYLKGSSRPDFMDKMITQTNEKLIETIKIMAIFYLNRVPTLLDYQKSLQKHLFSSTSVEKMTYEEISRTSANVQKEINELLTFSLNVAKSLSNVNTTPTKVEKLANALMNVSDSTRERIEEILRLDS